ncbi:MAG TPA: potassium transporter TrkG, partial [Longimicrobiales bacterium]|nr:potassium transporter TrkG [Longimicrobiales bacterium]
TALTFWGQAWLALLIQLGGLGILTLTTLVMTRLGRVSVSMEEAGSGNVPLRHVDERRLLTTVVAVTLVVEAGGALLLWLDWRGRFGAVGALWPALFHAVSAFCNAGFSLFPDSLVGLRTSPVTLGVVGTLIVLGGMGFVVAEDVRARARGRTDRLSVQSRLVLVSTAILLLVGWVYYLFFEWSHELSGLAVWDKVTNALFMSVTARTAGFNTVDYGRISNPSYLFTILLMLVGGSPGSAAGGIKTTTFATLILALRSRLKGETDVTVFERSLPGETISRATSLTLGSLIFLGCMVFLLMVTESPVVGYRDRGHLVDVVFEAHSAFGTVGLSTGVTASVAPASRLVLSLLMFAGRVGPAALVASMISAAARRRVSYRLGREDIMIG